MDTIQWLEHKGYRIERAGSLYRTICPFHGERTPSFYIFPDEHCWCFGGCPEEKSYYDLVELIYRLEFPNDSNRARAFEEARRLGAIPDSAPPRRISRNQRYPLPTDEQSEAMTIAFSLYHEFLFRRVGKPARDWLTDVRGLDGPLIDLALDTVGYVPEGARYHTELIERLQARFGDDWLAYAQTTGLVTRYGKQAFRNRIVFAVRDKLCRVLYYQGRSIETDPAYRYLNVSGLRKLPYIPIPREHARHAGTCIDEGPMDALAHAANGFYAIALMNTAFTSMLSPATLKSLPHPIIGSLDNDEVAGPSAQARLEAVCREHSIPYLNGHMPQGIKDPSEWLKREGTERFVHANASLLLAA